MVCGRAKECVCTRAALCGSESKECKKQITRTDSLSTGEELEGVATAHGGHGMGERATSNSTRRKFILLGPFLPTRMGAHCRDRSTGDGSLAASKPTPSQGKRAARRNIRRGIHNGR